MTTNIAENSLDTLLAGNPFLSYSYSYPHKTAYRPLEPARPLSDVWRDEALESLFLYMHVPFCEVRCGFCNLFTLTQPHEELPRSYLDAIRRQAVATREAVPDAKFARFALGGGTPTFLSCDELEELISVATDVIGARLREVPVSCEASPATMTAEKAALLREAGVDRLSIGVQSFNDGDSHAMGRPQNRDDVDAALQHIRDADFPTLNIDLIYGGETQTMTSWLETVEEALVWSPEELYLYPLYVRPLTGLGRLAHEWNDWRLTAYREARDLLIDRGYEQISLRMFRSKSAANVDGPIYCCQEDGMVGIGCGARSYTERLHYSREYGVGANTVRGILVDYINRTADEFALADYGFELDDEDQRRRYIIVSLLQVDGLSRSDYFNRFNSDPLSDFAELLELEPQGLAIVTNDTIQLTPAGIERSDVIGPWLNSAKVRKLMESYQWD